MQEEGSLKRAYEKRIAQKRKGYEITAKMIGYTIQKMKAAKIITGNVQIKGRLKSFKSARENYSKKAIDDCFGIRIIAEKTEDLEAIRRQLEKILVIEQTKDHRNKRETLYDAVHQMAHIDSRYIEANNLDPEIFPIIEIQYWSKELEIICSKGELAYSKYKKRNVDKIMETYAKNPYDVYANLPTCYEINGNKIRILSAEETLATIYPELESIMQANQAVESEAR